MAGFKQRSISLQQLHSTPNSVDSNSLDIFYLNDGSIRAKAFDGSEYRLDNIDTSLIAVSGSLYSLIQDVSGSLVVYVNEVSGSLYNTFNTQDQFLYSTIQTVSGDLQSQIITLDSNVVHKSGDETINGNKIFANTTYFMSGIVVNGDIVDIETVNLKIKDNIISLNNGVTGVPFLNSGIEVIRGISPNAQIIWDENLGIWTAGITGNLEKLIRQSDLDAAIDNISGGVIANIQTDITNLSGAIDNLYALVIDVSGNLSQDINNLELDLQSQIYNTNVKVTNISASIDSQLTNYTKLVTTAAISAGLQSEINNIVNNYTLTTTTANISAYLQSEIDAISGGTFINYYSKTDINAITGQQKIYIDNNFVNLTTNQTISGNKSFNNTLGNTVLSTQNTTLYDSFGITSVNWNTRQATDNLGIDSIDWTNRSLYDDLLNVTLDWKAKNLNSNWSTDSFNVLSLPTSGLGNFLTWNASKLLVDSGSSLASINAVTADISANLQAQINAILIESTTIASSSGNILVSNIGPAYNINVADYISKTSVVNVSAGLEAQIVEISGNVQNNTISINNIIDTYTPLATTLNISAGLQSEINNIVNNYTLTTTTANISAYLQSEIDAISGGTFINYYSKTDINAITGQQKIYIDNNFVNLTTNQTISGNKSFNNTIGNTVLSTQNTTLYDSFGIDSIDWTNRSLYDDLLNVTLDWKAKNLNSNWSTDSFNVLSLPTSSSGNFLTWNASKLLVDSGSSLASINAVTTDISANLQAQINAILIESTTITSSSGNILVSNIGPAYNINVADYISKTSVALISAGLEAQIIEISGNVQNNTISINNIIDTYTPLTTTLNISAGLQNEIDSLNALVVTVSGNIEQDIANLDLDLQSQIDSISGSVSDISGRLILVEARPIPNIFRSEVASVSAGLEAQIVEISGNVQNNTISINNIIDTYTPLTTTSSISAGLDSRLVIVEARPIPNIFFTEVAAMSADLHATDIYLQEQISTIVGITGSLVDDSTLVHKTGNETINGIKSFTSDISGNIDNSTLNLGTGVAQTIQIGGSNTNLVNIAQGVLPTTINIGSAGDTVNILGDLVYVKTTNAQVMNKTITLNVSGALGSSNYAGIYVEENDISGAGYARIDNTRNSWAFKAPNTFGSIWLTPSVNNVSDNISSSSTINRSFLLPNNSGTIALISDIPLSSSLVHTEGNENVYGIKNFHYPSNSLSFSTSGSGFYDTTTNKSIDWKTGILYTNTANSKSIDYANRYMYTSAGFSSLDWENKKLFDSNGYTSYDWGQRLAWYNNNSTIAINFSGTEVAINDISGSKAISSFRTLLNTGSVIVADWEKKELYGKWKAIDGVIIGNAVPVEYNSTKITSLSSLNVVIDTIATSSNDGSSWKVIISDGSNKRISTIDAIFTNSLIEYAEMGTKSIGDTSMVTLSCDVNSGSARLLASTTSGTWTIKVARINF